MRSAGLAMLLTSALASAEPSESHVEYAARAGYGWMTTEHDFMPSPHGTGPSIDGEVAWRSPALSVGAFGAFYTFRTFTDNNDQTNDFRENARYAIADLGWRANLHSPGDGGPYAGVGLALETTLEYGRQSSCYCENNYCNPCTPQYSNRSYSQWSFAPLFEVHLGFTLPKTGPVALDLLLILAYGLNPDDHSVGLSTQRLTVGARF
jgi:hypothetical protein